MGGQLDSPGVQAKASSCTCMTWESSQIPSEEPSVGCGRGFLEAASEEAGWLWLCSLPISHMNTVLFIYLYRQGNFSPPESMADIGKPWFLLNTGISHLHLWNDLRGTVLIFFIYLS